MNFRQQHAFKDELLRVRISGADLMAAVEVADEQGINLSDLVRRGLRREVEDHREHVKWRKRREMKREIPEVRGAGPP